MKLVRPAIYPSAQLPLRWRYPLVGVLLAAVTSIGLLAVRSIHSTDPFTMRWVSDEIESQIAVYGYIAVSTTALLIVLGGILGDKEDRLFESSIADPATGLPNRRFYERQLLREISCAVRYNQPLALLLVDVDRLKSINDTHGHAAGDRALRLVAESLRQTCRSRDIAARWGGDEFVVLAPGTTAREATVLAERIRSALLRLAIEDPGLPKFVSVSIGIADIESTTPKRPEALFQVADRALYLAKSGGRDRASTAPPLPRWTSSHREPGKGERGYANAHSSNTCAG